MNRTDVAYLISALLIVVVTAMTLLSYRYLRYRRDIGRGRRRTKPVRKPFWM